MSLIAKIQQQSLLQNKLQAQLAEMSYQAVNGTRQAPRNFREGTLEIGKMNFTTPQDRITKEMVMDYQKTQQEKHSNVIDPATGKPLLYQPTGLADAIDIFTPIPYAPLGAPATEEDVRIYEAEYIQLFNDLDALKTAEDKKAEEGMAKHAEVLANKEKVKEMKNDRAELERVLIENKTNLKEIDAKLVRHAARLAAYDAAISAGTTPPPTPVPASVTEGVAKGEILKQE